MRRNLPGVLTAWVTVVGVTFASLAALAPHRAVAQIEPTAQLSAGQLARVGLVQHWMTQVTFNPNRDRLQTVVISGDRLVAQATGGLVEAIDAQTGRRLWTASLTQARAPLPAATNSWLVAVASGSQLYLFDKRTGRTRWQRTLHSATAAPPAVTERHVFIPMFDGRLYAYDLAEQTLAWYYDTGGQIVAAPVPAADRVAVATRDGKLHVLAENTGRLAFRYATEAVTSAPPARLEHWLFLASEDYSVYAVDIRNGSTRWRLAFEGSIHAAPTVVEDELYVAPFNAGMYQVDINTGRREWWSPHPARFVSASPTRLYATNDSGQLLVLDRRTGRLLGALPVGGFEHRLRNDRTDRIYLATASGLVLCLRERDLPYPTFLQLKENEPILPPFAIDTGPAVPQR